MDLLKLLETFNQECSHAEEIHESSSVERALVATNVDIPALMNGDDLAPVLSKGQKNCAKDKTQTPISQSVGKGYRTIVQCILTNFDPMYQGIPASERRLFLKQRAMEVGTQLEENPAEYYQSFGFNPKVMKPRLIQMSFQLSLENKNTLASLLYLNELYKRNFTIVTDNHCVSTCPKNYPVETIVYQKGFYKLVTDTNKGSTKEVSLESSEIPIQNDLGKAGVYQTSLGPISKYKSEELKTLCTDNGIPLKKDGKAKLKTQLYHEIYLHLLNA